MVKYERKGFSYSESEYRKEDVKSKGIHVGEMIRTRLLKRVDNGLLRKGIVDEPSDKVPPMKSKIFDPYAQVVEIGEDLTGDDELDK